MATDGTDLYLAVDAEPKDKILKLDPQGNLVAGFGVNGAADAPGTEVGGLAFQNGFLYVATNDERTVPDPFGQGFFIERFPALHKIDPNTGEELARRRIDVNDAFAGVFKLLDSIGSLASDGQFLYAGVKGTEGIQGAWFKIDPQFPPGAQNPPAERIDEFAGRLRFMPGFEAFEIIVSPEFPEDRQLVAAGQVDFGTPGTPDLRGVVSRFDREAGVMFDQFELTDITGMAYIGARLFMADDDTDTILGTAFLENSPVEVTLATSGPLGDDDFAANFSVMVDSTTLDADPALFRFGRRGTVEVAITSHVEGQVLTDPVTTIEGLVADSSVTSVEVGIELPFTRFIDDSVDAASVDIWDVNSGTGGAAIWHIACSDGSLAPDFGFPNNPRTSSAPCSWRYAIPDGASGDFDTGERTQGTLTTADPVTASQGSGLSFFTAFATELAPDTDVKSVKLAQVTQDAQGNDQDGEFRPILQIVGPGGGQAAQPLDALPGFRFAELEPLFINPNLARIDIDLSSFAGQRLKIRFEFDSVNRFANDGEGFYIDDIVFFGSGTRTIQMDAVRLTEPVVLGGISFPRRFTTPFELAEGVNRLVAKATQPYRPRRSGTTSVSVSVDTTAPVVVLFGISASVNTPVQILFGNVDDETLVSLEVTQATSGVAPGTIFSVGESGAFSVPVSLVEGLNTFVATALDGGNLTGADTFEVILDTVAPTVVDEGPIFPVGAVSARTEDDIIFQVTADDGHRQRQRCRKG